MKKTMKKLIALAVVFVMLLTAVPAFASGQSCIYGEDTVSAVFYPNQKMHNQYFGSVGSTKTSDAFRYRGTSLCVTFPLNKILGLLGSSGPSPMKIE